MFFNYLRVALRNLRRNGRYVIINTLGMGISIACCITAYFLLAFNMEFDNFHDDEKVSRIFNVHTLARKSDGTTFRDVQAPLVLLPIASQEIAGIERYVRFLHGGGALSYRDKAFNESVAFADSTFFDLFDFPLSAGNKDFFHDRDRIFLSQEIAEKYFGIEDPTGKLMLFTSENGTEIELLVGGVLDKFPANNSFFFNILIRIEHHIQIHEISDNDWSDSRNPSTLVELSSQAGAAEVSGQLSKYIPERNRLRPEMKVESYELVSFKAPFSWDDVRMSRLNHRRPSSWFMSTVLMAGFILLIACFNLMNTTIAMAGGRLKEIGNLPGVVQ